MALFAIQNLSFTYPGASAPALSHVSLEVSAGSYTVLCGKSGCGKTTLLRQLKPALTPHGTVEGTVRFDGAALSQLGEREQAAQIGFVMQDPEAQVVTDKVWHELAFGLESLGCDPRTMRLRVAEMASYFGIQQWFHRDVRDLSGGQKQLLNLASVMALQPRVLILDEPTSQLDPLAASTFLDTVRKINRDLGCTVILSEHRLEEVFPAADRVVVMEAGCIIADDEPRAVGAFLHRSGHDLLRAVPTPLRIYFGVRGAKTDADAAAQASEPAEAAAPSDPGGVFSDTARCPLTVREGRTWLARAYGAQAAHAPALPPEPPFDPQVPAAVEFHEVWQRYGRQEPDVLRDANLRVPQARVTALVGGNGTGKSTLLKAVCGIVRPYRGTVRVLGRKVGDYRHGSLFDHGVALLPQDPQLLFLQKTVRADLEDMLPAGGDAHARAEQVRQAAAQMGVEALLDRHPHDLSGGEQQRAALAKVLLAHPQVLLLDEPTKGIDEFLKERLGQLLGRLTRQGVTVLMASHDIEFCARYADLAALVFDGSVITANTPRRFFSHNSFYTTAANRMARDLFPDAVTDQEVIALCRQI